MKIIHKYVLREHAGPLVFAASALTSLLLLNYIAKQFGNLVGKGLPWSVIGEFFLLSVPFTVAMTLPMSVLVATLYAFSRLAAENEITALKASGVSLTRLTTPVLIAAAFIALLMVFFNDQVLPRSNHRLRTLQGDIARKKPTFALREQVINEVSPGKLFIRANHLDEFSNKMREVTIYDIGDPLRRRTIYGDSGTMAFAPNGSDLQLTLWHGHMLEVPKDKPLELQRLYFDIDHVRVPDVANQLDLTKSDAYKSDREMSVCELQNEVARNEYVYDKAATDLRTIMAGAVREAVSGAPMALPVDTGAAINLMPGSPAPRSRHFSFGRTYCDLLARLDALQQGSSKRRSAPSKVAMLLGVRELHAENVPVRQAQDTTPAEKDSSARRDTTRATHDTTRAKKDATRAQNDTTGAKRDTATAGRDSAVIRPDTVLRPTIAPPTRADINPQLPIPAPPGPPVTRVDTLPFTPSGMTPSTMPSRIGTVLPSQPFVLASAIDGARARIADSRSQVNSNAVEVHKKFAISIACFVFVLIGAPIALRFPRGGVGLVISVSLLVFAIYYVGLIAGEALGDRGIVPPAAAMWAANVLFAAIGLLMLARIGREGATARGGDMGEILDSLKSFGRRLRPGREKA